MTPEQALIFAKCTALGIACELQHRYEHYTNAQRSLLHCDWNKLIVEGDKIAAAFVAFEKMTASCEEEQAELDKLTPITYSDLVSKWYDAQRAKYEKAQT